jgi:hypothetical protein
MIGSLVSSEDWKTADLVRIGDSPEVWELSTFWNGADGTAMATLERQVGGTIMVSYSPVANLRRAT